MNEPQRHEMVLETTHPSGAEEWNCPACGRRFLLYWPPSYRRIILNAGDELAWHTGGKGGLSMGPVQVHEAEEAVLPERIRAAIEKILERSDLEDSSGPPDSEP